VSAEPSDEFFVAAQRVKERLRRVDAGEKEELRMMKVSDEDVTALWQGSADEEEEVEEQRRDKPIVSLIKGIYGAVRNLFRRDDGIREAPRVLTKKSRSRSNRHGRLLGGGYVFTQICSDGGVQFWHNTQQQRTGRRRSFMLFSYTSGRQY
jgi:hypothetical protein